MPELDPSTPATAGFGLDATRPPDLTVVIVSWNTRELLARCLSSVRQQLHTSQAGGEPAVELVVVDNASLDGTPEMVLARFPDVGLIANTDNVGFARANNQAIRGSSGRYVLLLNPDTEALPGSVEALVRFMDAEPMVGAAGARTLNGDGSLYPSCQPAPTLSRELWRLFHLDRLRLYSCYPMACWDLRTPRQVDAAGGACLILRRDALNEVGLLDEDYFIYSEEIDLCRRLRRGGWQVWWVPEAVVTHYGGQSTRQVAAAMFLRLHESKVIYFRKNHGPRAARAYKLMVLGAALARVLASPLGTRLNASDSSNRLASASYYRRLVRELPGW